VALIGERSPGRTLLEGALRPFAQILLSRDLVTGGLVVGALLTFPRAAAAALLALLVAQGTTLALGFGVEAVRDGAYACAAVLTALAAMTGPDGSSWALIVAGAALAVLVAAAITHVLAKYSLPALSLPFVVAAWVVQLTARLSPHADGAAMPHLAFIPVEWFGTGWLDIPAAVLYLHGTVAGVLVIAAIAWHSRIALLLAVVGVLGAALAHVGLRSGVDIGPTDLTAAFNALLTAMALGGVWFVPHPTSILLALLGGATASVLTYALFPLSGVLSVPLLSLPFALTTLLVITAFRMRARDRNPATALLTASNPEDALERHLMRVRRFGDFAWLPFRLPFRGSWTVTQAHNGAHTHQGPWRYAFDFEIVGADGRAWEGEGREPRDFRCYNLPVLAAGTGTVDSVRDGIPDNAIGGMNARENWGNTVVIAHGSDLYSVYSHLKPGSIIVKVGDPIRAGAELGRCGNSGRSLVPHLHFHVQRGPALGSETVAADFGDVVTRTDDAVLVSHRVIPALGAKLRPIMRDEALAATLSFPPGSEWILTEPKAATREIARVEVDLWGRRVLRSDRGALYLESYENALVVVAFDGAHDSLLRYLLLAMARVPFDQDGAVRWVDRVPRRLLMSWPWGFLDLLAVVAPGLNDWEVRYAARRTEGTLTVEGTSDSFRSISTISLAGGAHTLTVTHGASERVITIAPHDQPREVPS
jgi:murein DD-endopeptidase MepM/ murein hydrolase activator NlpD